MPVLDLTVDQLLSTTRAVRKRFDLARPVEREVLNECFALAQQAPTASNLQHWHFVVVTDAAKRAALAELYRRSMAAYRKGARTPIFTDPKRAAIHARVISSADYLREHLHEVPVHVIPCISGRPEGKPTYQQSGLWASIIPATWSFMLAARSRGLGTCWTSFHLFYEEEAAKILGIPYEEITQVALIPVAYTKGTDFKPAPREELRKMVHWNTW
jgi:nitroreductase